MLQFHLLNIRICDKPQNQIVVLKCNFSEYDVDKTHYKIRFKWIFLFNTVIAHCWMNNYNIK